MTDYTDLKRRLRNEVNAGWVPDIALEAAAAIAALEAEVARLRGLANMGLDKWQAIADDLLQGADWYDDTISEIAAARAFVIEKTVTSPQPAPHGDKT